MSARAIWLGALLVGCGGAAVSSAPAETAERAALDEAPLAPPRSEGTIARAELDAVLEAGLGRFLGRVTTEAHLEAAASSATGCSSSGASSSPAWICRRATRSSR